MNIVDNPNQAPGICFLCENFHAESRYAELPRVFQPGGPTKLNGRKYVCEHCVKELGAAFDLFPSEKIAKAERDLEVRAIEVEVLKARIADFVEKFGGDVRVEVEAAIAAKKAKSKKADVSAES